MKPVMVHRFRRLFTGQHQGSAALITTIAISSILVVLFIGITTIATREIKQSISADNSSRALYAAEAGVEDAVRQLSNDPTFTESSCNSRSSGAEVKVGAEGGTDTAWTCRTVTQFGNTLEGRLDKDQAIQVDLSKARLCDVDVCTTLPVGAVVRYMTIEWNDPRVDSAIAHGNVARGSNYLPSYLSASDSAWEGRTAALELTATWYKKALGPGDLTANVFPVRTVLASPVCNSGAVACTTEDFSPLNGGSGACTSVVSKTNSQSCFPTTNQNAAGVPAGSLQSQLSVACTNASTARYSCSMPYNIASSVANAVPATTYDLLNLLKTEVQDPTTMATTQASCPDMKLCNTLIRIKPRYAAASYRIQFYYADGSAVKPVSLSDGYATIDVTARSGQNFRRVQAKKQLQPTVFTGIFDSTLFSGSTVCKTLSVYKDFRGAPDKLPGTVAPYLPSDNGSAGKNVGCENDD